MLTVLIAAMPSPLNFSVENLISNRHHHHHHHHDHHHYHRHHHHNQQQQQQRDTQHSIEPNSGQASEANIISHPSSNGNDISPAFTATINKLPSAQLTSSTFNQDRPDVKPIKAREHLTEATENSVECVPGTSRELPAPNIISNLSCRSDYQTAANNKSNNKDNNISNNNSNNNNINNNSNINNSISSTSCRPIVCLSAPIPQTLSYFDIILPHVQVTLTSPLFSLLF